jgi:hypothetical protein
MGKYSIKVLYIHTNCVCGSFPRISQSQIALKTVSLCSPGYGPSWTYRKSRNSIFFLLGPVDLNLLDNTENSFSTNAGHEIHLNHVFCLSTRLTKQIHSSVAGSTYCTKRKLILFWFRKELVQYKLKSSTEIQSLDSCESG